METSEERLLKNCRQIEKIGLCDIIKPDIFPKSRVIQKSQKRFYKKMLHNQLTKDLIAKP